MITKELTDYVKSSLAQGKTKEEVKTILRAQGGWTEQDLAEAFATPVKNSRMLLKILISIIIIGLGIVGYFAYKSDAFQNAFLKNEAPVATTQTETPVQNSQTEPTPLAENTTPTNQVADTSIAPEKDCGVSQTIDFILNAGPTYAEEYLPHLKNDTAIKCMGESIIQCSNAKIAFTSDVPKTSDGVQLDLPEPTLQVFSKNGTCYFRVTDKSKTRFNKYNECPLNIIKKANPSFSEYINLTASDKKDPVAYTTYTANYGTVGFMYDIIKNLKEKTNEKLAITEIENKYQALGCTGDILPLMIDSLKVSRTKSINALTRNIINDVYKDAETYYDPSNVGYKNVCTAKLQVSINKLKDLGVSTTKCFDSKDFYAITASLTSGGFYCADNTDFKGEIKTNITGPKCQ